MAARSGMALVGILIFLGAVTAYDKYEDAMAKYKMWHSKHGGTVQIRRPSALTATDRRGQANSIFQPHRPSNQGGRQFQPASVSQQTNIFGFQDEIQSPSLVRGTRGNQFSNQVGLGGAEYVSAHGNPIYKLRKRNPLYGRRKRDTDTVKGARQGWTILDPSTGRPVEPLASDRLEDVGSSPVQRITRDQEPQQLRDFYRQGEVAVAVTSGGEYLRSDGTPLYKTIKSSPYRGKRDAERILHRVPREPQAPRWVLLDPSTGRPREQVESLLTPTIRIPRRPQGGRRPQSVRYQQPSRSYSSWTNSAGESQPIYKYYKKNPYSG